MQPPPALVSTAIPGMRISHYRNSARRAISLIGLGAAASDVVNRIAERGLPNVATRTCDTASGWPAGAGDVNMIVIVCREGDAHLFRPAAGRRDVPVTFVLLRDDRNTRGRPREAELDLGPELEWARACSDLFVTTSDPDYVAELMENLAS
jgi:hypothetical protein